MRCEKCGESLSVREKFCGRCGADNKSYSADGMLKCAKCGRSYITPDEKCPYCNRTDHTQEAMSGEQDRQEKTKPVNVVRLYEQPVQYNARPTTFKELLFAFLSEKLGISVGHYSGGPYRPLGKFIVCPTCGAECAPEDAFCYICGDSLRKGL